MGGDLGSWWVGGGRDGRGGNECVRVAHRLVPLNLWTGTNTHTYTHTHTLTHIHTHTNTHTHTHSHTHSHSHTHTHDLTVFSLCNYMATVV